MLRTLFWKQHINQLYIYIYVQHYLVETDIYTLLVYLFVCLFVSNKKSKRLNRSGPNFLWDIYPREVLWMIKISNICLHQNSIFIKFLKILKIHEIFCENPRIIFVLFFDVHKENMFTINLEDGREAPSKASKIYSEISWTAIYGNWLIVLLRLFIDLLIY